MNCNTKKTKKMAAGGTATKSKVNEAGNYTKPKATGERYLPEAAIKALSPAEYAATTEAKRKGKKAGKQFVSQPKTIAKKVKKFRD